MLTGQNKTICLNFHGIKCTPEPSFNACIFAEKIYRPLSLYSEQKHVVIYYHWMAIDLHIVIHIKIIRYIKHVINVTKISLYNIILQYNDDFRTIKRTLQITRLFSIIAWFSFAHFSFTYHGHWICYIQLFTFIQSNSSFEKDALLPAHIPHSYFCNVQKMIRN